MHMHVCFLSCCVMPVKVMGQHPGVSSFMSYGSLRQDAGLQAWWREPLLIEPLFWLLSYFEIVFFNNLIQIFY